jgi:hypothetical protein
LFVRPGSGAQHCDAHGGGSASDLASAVYLLGSLSKTPYKAQVLTARHFTRAVCTGLPRFNPAPGSLLALPVAIVPRPGTTRATRVGCGVTTLPGVTGAAFPLTFCCSSAVALAGTVRVLCGAPCFEESALRICGFTRVRLAPYNFSARSSFVADFGAASVVIRLESFGCLVAIT